MKLRFSKKRLKILAIVGIIGLFLTTGLVVWLGIAAVQFASNQIQVLELPNGVESLATQIGSLPAAVPPSCWAKAQSLMSYEAWLTRPIGENLLHLKTVCIGNAEQTL